MGQAKQRGSQDERARQAQAKIEAMKPAMIVCNACEAEITDVHAMDVRGMPGIQAVFAGMCDCGNTTHAMLGDPEAVADLVAAIESTSGEQAILGSQPAIEKLKRRGIPVHVVFWKHASRELKEVATRFIPLDDYLTHLSR